MRPVNSRHAGGASGVFVVERLKGEAGGGDYFRHIQPARFRESLLWSLGLVPTLRAPRERQLATRYWVTCWWGMAALSTVR
jgi:hypothetical protein